MTMFSNLEGKQYKIELLFLFNVNCLLLDTNVLATKYLYGNRKFGEICLEDFFL